MPLSLLPFSPLPSPSSPLSLLPSSFPPPPRLTVTDADGAYSIAYANVTVHPEKDYPPVANAEGPLLIYLPKDEVYLYGNKSTDDKVTIISTVNCPIYNAC